jgi:hypothetical protein
MIEMDLLNLISNVGFPITITLYFIIRMEKTLKDNSKVIGDLKELVRIMYVKINGGY